MHPQHAVVEIRLLSAYSSAVEHAILNCYVMGSNPIGRVMIYHAV